MGQVHNPALQVKDLRMTFSIKKTSTSTSNSAKVQIYNLNAQSRKFMDFFDIEEAKNLLIVKAGYQGQEKTVFVGNITVVSIALDKPNIITTLEALDGEKTLNQLKLHITYQGGTAASKIINDIIQASGLEFDPIDWPTIGERYYVNGFCFEGMAKVLLDNVCNYLGLIWSIQNNKFKFNPVGGTDGFPIISLRPETGLLSSPIRLNDVNSAVLNKKEQQKEVTTPGTKKKKCLSGGYEIRCLLQPNFEPGGVVNVQSQEIDNKNFRIFEVEHVGDTHGNDWTTKLTTMAL
jgi:hypothetical protein